MRYIFVYDILRYYGTIDYEREPNAKSSPRLPYPILPLTLGHYSLSSQLSICLYLSSPFGLACLRIRSYFENKTLIHMRIESHYPQIDIET